jgi:hypothetical protein
VCEPDEQILWSDSLPEDCLVYGGPSISTEKDLWLLLALGSSYVEDGPGEPWEAAMASALRINPSDIEIPWSKAMPRKAWEAYARKLCGALRASLKEVGSDYHKDVYSPSQRILEALRPACINASRWAEYVDDETNKSNMQALMSFNPASIVDGHQEADSIEYSRLTTTGRLKVDEGPEILRLKKSYRNVIESRYDDGQIVSLDYVSLEPRLSLQLAGKPVPDDVYQDIMENVLDGKLERKRAKLLVLSVLYGAGTKKIQETLDIDVVTISSYIMLIKKYFGVKDITKMLVAEQIEHGFIRNFYGKVIRLANPVAHKLYNAYVQSTAVDVALLGFSNLDFGDDAVPLYVIHDALIADYKKGAVIDTAPAESVPGFSGLLLETTYIHGSS